MTIINEMENEFMRNKIITHLFLFDFGRVVTPHFQYCTETEAPPLQVQNDLIG